MTQAVGMIVDAQQAEEILAADDADLIAIGREALSILSGLGTRRTRSAQTPELLESPQRGPFGQNELLAWQGNWPLARQQGRPCGTLV